MYSVHKEAGARFIPFAGWEMPVQFSGIIKEHIAVRSSAGLFDLNHMGEIEVIGDGAEDFLQYIITNDLNAIGDGDAQYTVMCNEDGGTVDDLLVYRINRERYMLCVNAVNTEKDYLWMVKNSKGKVQITDKTADYALLALQGPHSKAALQPSVKGDMDGLKRFGFILEEMNGAEAMISRTGYTGEDGFEIFLPSDKCSALWKELLAAGSEYGIKPVGLGARDTLRLEMGYPLYGNELSQDTDPLEAGLGWVVKMDKGHFMGRDALLSLKEQGTVRRLVGLEMIDRGIARHGHRIFSDGKDVGYITSGTMSPSLKVSIAMGYVSSEMAKEGTVLEVDIRGRLCSARVVKRPFYKPSASGG